LRLDGNGDVVWDKTFGDEKDTAAGSIAALPDSGFAVVGLTRSPEASNARIMRLDADGRLLWETHAGAACEIPVRPGEPCRASRRGLVLADKIKLETGGTRDAAIGERGSQDRLLAETLKPVFSG